MSTLNINSPTDFANALLGALGVPDTKNNVQNIVGWETSEGGNWHNPDKYNPLDTTLNMPDAVSTNSVGVKAYTSWDQGLQATVDTLTQSDPSYNYQGIIDSLNNNGDWLNFRQAVINSSWGGKGNPYLDTYATPPGTSASADATSSSSYSAGTSAAGGNTNADNNPSNATAPRKLTGFAGVLQMLDGLYNPARPSGSWNPLTDINNIPKDIQSTAIEIFVRAASSILFLGICAMGINAITSGRSTSGGSGSGTSNVIEFINNAKLQNRKLDLSNTRAELQRTKEQDVKIRYAQRLTDNEATRASRDKLQNRKLDLSNTRAELQRTKEQNVKIRQQDVKIRHAQRLTDNEATRASRERIASIPRTSYQRRESHIFYHREPKPERKPTPKPTPKGK